MKPAEQPRWAKIGERLRQLRENRKLTQAEVGKMLDLDHTTVNKHECGLNGLTPDLVRAYSRLYKIDSVSLFF